MLSVLLELQRLKRLDRTGWVLRGLPPGAESVAAHSYGVALTAMLLADECAARGVAVDAGRVLRIALLHDLQETRTGDMPRTDADYESRASLEARIVKAADVIDLLAQALAFERAGSRGLEEFWDGAAERDFRLEGAAREVVREVVA